MHINYDELLANYKKNMETNLRGFTGGPPPFETWVPYDGDDQKSKEELVSLARGIGHEVIYVNDGCAFFSERASKAESLLQSKCPEHMIRVMGLKKNVLTIDYAEPIGGNFHSRLIALEGEINQELGETFDIQTLNVEDKNKRKCGPR